MVNGVVNVNLGFALGQHTLRYNLAHTGKGYVSIIADMPPYGSREFRIAPTEQQLDLLTKINDICEAYKFLLKLKKKIPLIIADNPTFELNKISELNKDKETAIFSRFFNAKASLEIDDIKQFIQILEVQLKVEITRSGKVA